MTAHTAHKHLGELLVEQAWLRPSELESVLAEQERDGHRERLGEVISRLGLMSSAELDAVVAFRDAEEGEAPLSAGDGAIPQRLGDILLKARRLTPRQLERALEVQRQTNEKLGEVLVRFGLITDVELEAVLAWQEDRTSSGAGKVKYLLGEVLLATGQISAGQLEDALRRQRLTRRQIGEILVDAGYVQPNQISEALKIQSKLVAASLVGMLALGTLSGCGLTAAPLVPDQTAKGAPQGVAQPYETSPQGASPINHFSVSGAHSVTVYRNGARIVDNVPFFQQDPTDNTCAQAAMSVVLNYWGRSVSYQDVVDGSNRFNLPTTHETISSFLSSKGLQVAAFKDGQAGYLKHLVDQGRPPLVLLDYGGMSEHYVVVIGYNDRLHSFILHDSIDGPYTVMPYDRFMSRWQNAALQGVPFVDGDNYHGLVFDVQG